jgi:hypothetical protein
MHYSDLTENQKDLARWFVKQVSGGDLSEEFVISWISEERVEIGGFRGKPPAISKGMLDALAAAELLICIPEYQTSDYKLESIHGPVTQRKQLELRRRCVLTGKAFKAVNSNFATPDTSFVTHLTPLADVTNLDNEIKTRCLPILGAGSADPRLWDSAVRTAGVILEERLHTVGGIADSGRVGRELVNDVFGKQGTLVTKFPQDSERQGYRDLYAGVVGALRNPYAHRLVDPTPEDGGATIIFVNLLLKMLEDLR